MPRLNTFRSRAASRSMFAAAMAVVATASLLVTSVPSAEAATVPTRPLKVVILGDSYAAGNGAGENFDSSAYYGPSSCYRSHTNWGERYVQKLRDDGFNIGIVINRACSGGVIDDVDNRRDMDDERKSSVVVNNEDVAGTSPDRCPQCRQAVRQLSHLGPD